MDKERILICGKCGGTMDIAACRYAMVTGDAYDICETYFMDITAADVSLICAKCHNNNYWGGDQERLDDWIKEGVYKVEEQW
jgi:hypothetical protein